MRYLSATSSLPFQALRALGTMALATAASACVSDPQIATDHPQMQGELSCSTFVREQVAAFAAFAQRYKHEPASATEKLIAHWNWRLEHHQHADGNVVCYGPGNKLAGEDGFGFCRDGLMGMFASSTGLCFSIHAQFSAIMQQALGDYLATSCTLVPGHTSFEAYTDGAWRLADITCGHMVFDQDAGKPLGILDIAADQGRLGELNGGFLKCRIGPFGDALNTYGSVREPEGEGKQKMFGYLGMPIVYSLHAGESFTRSRLPDGDDGVDCIWSRDYNEQAFDFPKHHGMARRETFLSFGSVGDDHFGRVDKANGRSPKNPLVYSGKGVFDYAPDLKSSAVVGDPGWVASGDVKLQNGKFIAANAGGAIILTQTSPYQIAAHQADNADAAWDVYKNPCDKGAIVSGSGAGAMTLGLSIDAGQTWDDLGPLGKTFTVDFTDKVKGRFSYQLKVTLPAHAELSAFALRTVVQIGPAVFPWLKDEGSVVTYQASGRGVIHGGPDYRMAKAFRDAALDSDGWKVYKITASGPIRSLHGVAMPTGRVEMAVETSIDGKTWDSAMAPVTLSRGGTDKNSSIWGNGYNGIMWGSKEYPQGKVDTGFIRLKNADETTVQVYATYESPGKSMPLTMTVDWSDDSGADHQSTNQFKADAQTQTWKVATGKNTVTNWIRFEPGVVAPAKAKSKAVVKP